MFYGFDFRFCVLDFVDLGFLLGPFHIHRIKLVFSILQFFFQIFESDLAHLIVFFVQSSTFDFKLQYFSLSFVDAFRHRIYLSSNHRARFVHQINRLIRQKSVSNISVRQSCRSDYSIVCDFDSVINLVFILDTAQYRNSVFN